MTKIADTMRRVIFPSCIPPRLVSCVYRHEVMMSIQKNPGFNQKRWSSIKKEARRTVTRARRDGELVAAACEVCGNPNAEAHHDDYLNPLEVRWLCQHHHYEHHYCDDAVSLELKSKSPSRYEILYNDPEAAMKRLRDSVAKALELPPEAFARSTAASRKGWRTRKAMAKAREKP